MLSSFEVECVIIVLFDFVIMRLIMEGEVVSVVNIDGLDGRRVWVLWKLVSLFFNFVFLL